MSGVAKTLADIRASRSTDGMEQKELFQQSRGLISKKSWPKLLLPNSSVFQESEMPFSLGLRDSLSTS